MLSSFLWSESRRVFDMTVEQHQIDLIANYSTQGLAAYEKQAEFDNVIGHDLRERASSTTTWSKAVSRGKLFICCLQDNTNPKCLPTEFNSVNDLGTWGWTATTTPVASVSSNIGYVETALAKYGFTSNSPPNIQVQWTHDQVSLSKVAIIRSVACDSLRFVL